MAETAADRSTTPHPISPISPTEALKLVLSRDPNRSIHEAAKDLTEWVHGNNCRLWCNGNLLHPRYITISLKIVAETEADDRPRAEVVSSTREAWDDPPAAYAFELDADEMRTLLPSLKLSPLPSESPPAAQATEPSAAPVPPAAPETLEGTERWVFEQMRDDPPRKGDHGYVQKVFNRRPDKSIMKKTIANNVGKYRKGFEIP
jgi:hypothetical protein